jgi:hypothetical protein
MHKKINGIEHFYYRAPLTTRIPVYMRRDSHKAFGLGCELGFCAKKGMLREGIWPSGEACFGVLGCGFWAFLARLC